MNYLKAIVVALFAVSEVYGATRLECPSNCPPVYRPTCGTNGKEFVKFYNLCGLATVNCNRQRLQLSTYKETHIEWCTTIDLDGVKIDLDLANPSCNIPIPALYQPVCGTDGIYRKSFSSEWDMKSFSCSFKYKNSSDWRVLEEGSCSQHKKIIG